MSLGCCSPCQDSNLHKHPYTIRYPIFKQSVWRLLWWNTSVSGLKKPPHSPLIHPDSLESFRKTTTRRLTEKNAVWIQLKRERLIPTSNKSTDSFHVLLMRSSVFFPTVIPCDGAEMQRYATAWVMGGIRAGVAQKQSQHEAWVSWSGWKWTTFRETTKQTFLWKWTLHYTPEHPGL